jgi:hypothetical protein
MLVAFSFPINLVNSYQLFGPRLKTDMPIFDRH